MTRLTDFLAASEPYLEDGGAETCLIFGQGFDLPMFASFVLYETEAGRSGMRQYFEPFVTLARKSGTGFLLDTATWRAGKRWGAKLGYDERAIRDANAAAVALAREWRAEWEEPDFPIVINGVVGPSGDGYAPEELFSASEAEDWHRPQVEALAEAGADLITALTMTHPGEAIGVARAAKACAIPVVLSFTLETDGNLPTGQTLASAIGEVEADSAPVLFYGVNCAHPSHFRSTLRGDWTNRIGLVRANASRMSHAELDESETLDDGDPVGFGREHAELALLLPGLKVIGGCCGTDHRHVGCAATGFHAGRGV